MNDLPLVTCIMPTGDRRRFVPLALRCFLRQEYPRKELIVIDDGTDPVGDLLPPDERVRYVRVPRRLTVGAKRNLACEHAAGTLIAHWDDDDWSAPWRLRYQVEELHTAGADICGLDRVLFYAADQRRAWEYVYPAGQRSWVYGASLCYQKHFWATHRFRDISVGEDSHFVWADARAKIHPLADNRFLVATVHGGNVSPKRTADPAYQPIPVAEVAQLLGADAGGDPPPGQLNAVPAVPPSDAGGRRPTALITASPGIGDILRMTPLMRAAHRLGYEVDVLLGTDYPGVDALLAGAPEIRRVFHLPSRSLPDTPAPAADLDGRCYDVATFSPWSTTLRSRVRAQRVLELDRATWLDGGYPHGVERLAQALGWQGPLPDPFALASNREFALAPGTVAIHPGCNAVSPWKRWHGFDELARRFSRVAIIGTAEDLQTGQTYFGRGFQWPEQARNFVGLLSLPDTAALLRQCVGLVANDSGLMHLGVALGVPTVGIFGITSPEREAFRSTRMFPISKGLPCEPACRRGAWGRRDCDHHLHCLKTLTVDDVMQRVATHLPGVATGPVRLPVVGASRPVEPVSVAVHITGGVGDALLATCLLRELAATLKEGVIDVFFHTPEVARFVFRTARFVREILPAAQFPAASSRYNLAIHASGLVRCEVRNENRLRQANPEFADALAEAGRRFSAHRGLMAGEPLMDGFWARLSVLNGRNRRSSMGYLTGLPIGRDAQLLLTPDAAEYAFFGQVLGGAEPGYITVHDGFDTNVRLVPGAATKCWPLSHWGELVSRLKEAVPGLRVVQLGGRNSRAIPGVDLNLLHRTTLAQVPWILKHARLHVDGDSGLVHLARAVHTRSLVLFGPTNRAYFAYDQNINLAPAGCTDCWWSTRTWLSQCPRGLPQPECMESISPGQVFDEAFRAVSAPRAEKIELTASALYGDPGAVSGDDALSEIFAVSGLPVVPISEHSQATASGVYLHASKQWEYVFAWRQLTAHLGPGCAGLHIADVGGGRGALAPFLAARGAAVEVFDQDYLWDHGGDPRIEGRFLRWTETRGYRAHFGSLFNLPAEDRSYDVVTSISVVEHIEHKEYAIREAFRVLKPGGLLILTFDLSLEPRRHRDGLRREIFCPESLDETLVLLGVAPAGFTREAVAGSARQIQADRVLGIPAGMTVGGIVIRKGQ